MKKVLLINDDPDFQYLIKSFLERKGYDAATMNGDEPIIPKVKEYNPHVIIIDMKMENDMKICSEIRKNLTSKDVRVVLLTDQSIQSPLTDCDPDAVIQKPFQPNELLNRIDEIV